MKPGTLVAAIGIAVLAGASGYWLGHRGEAGTEEASPMHAKAPMGAPGGTRKILYYRNPMGLADTSPVPKKDSMGMDYTPVYANEAGSSANEVQVSPDRIQTLGVRTAAVQLLPALTRSIRATGVLQFDERRLATVTTKAGGWVEKLNVAATGDAVHAGEPLLEIYSPDIVTAEDEYLIAAQMSAHVDDAHGGSALLLDSSLRRLRALDVPEGEIQRLRRTGRVARRIAVLAPADGIVTEKDAVLGMRVDPGSPLYKTADLSVVWLIAQVQEQDMGAVKPGQHARATFVAYPGRVFDGVVDFVYPTLMAETRTARMRIAIANQNRALRESMYATVTIESPATSRAPALAVPDSAVIDSGSRKVVLVALGQGRFAPRAVRIGARGDGSVEVLGGLKAGEQVVVSANFLIDAESNLQAALKSFAADQSKGADSETGGTEP